MGKKGFYLLLSVITFIFLFTISAVCNDSNIGLKREIVSEEERRDIEIMEGEPSLADANPTISLSIYEGPIYSEADNVCYYRIEATVTGDPAPEVEFSRDDSNGAFGPKKSQINLTSPEDSYNLTATATNSDGTASDSIELVWNCDGNDASLSEVDAPTISLSIYEGPIYSEADNVCYYRIEATVTGDPAPEVEFSRDDSSGAWGSKKCQINLSSPNETYTLNATATNTIGSDTSSLELIWGCDGEVDINEDIEITEGETQIEVTPEDQMAETEVILHPSTIGYAPIIGDANYSVCFFGDTSQNLAVKGFFEFDLNSLVGKNIISATLLLANPTIYGDPSFTTGCVRLHNLYHFAQLDTYEYGQGVHLLKDCSGSDNFVQSSNLESIITDTIDPRSSNKFLKFKIYYSDYDTDGDYEKDGKEYSSQNVSLTVIYN